jgi:tetratricopeptide (TPR) repeat protein
MWPRSLRRRRIAAALAVGSLVQAGSAALPDGAVPLGNDAFPPGAVLLIRQRDGDLEIGTRRGAGVWRWQDGPDQRIGTEVLVLGDAGTKDVVVRHRHGAAPRFEARVLSGGADAPDRRAAEQIAAGARAFRAGDPAGAAVAYAAAAQLPFIDPELRRIALQGLLELHLHLEDFAPIDSLLADERIREDLGAFLVACVQARAAFVRRDYRAAAQHFERAVELGQRAEPAAIDVGTAVELGAFAAASHVMVARETRDALLAAQMQERLIGFTASAIATGSDRLIAEVLNLQSIHSIGYGDHRRTIELLTGALEHIERADDPVLAAAIRNNLAIAAGATGDLGRAVVLMNRVWVDATDDGGSELRAFAEYRLGRFYLEAGVFDRALRHLEAAAALHREAGRVREEMLCATLAAGARREHGDARGVIETQRAAVDRLEVIGDLQGAWRARRALAESLLALGPPGSAETEVARLDRDARTDSERIEASRMLAQLEVVEGWPGRAAERLQALLKQFEGRLPRGAQRLRILGELARARALAGETELALEASGAAVALLESLTAQLTGSWLAPQWRSRAIDIVDTHTWLLALLHLRTGDPDLLDSTLTALDRSLAFGSLDSDFARLLADADRADVERPGRDELVRLRMRLAELDDDRARGRLRRRIDEAEARVLARMQLGPSSPPEQAHRTIAEVRGTLGSGQALLALSLGRSTAVAIRVTRAEAHVLTGRVGEDGPLGRLLGAMADDAPAGAGVTHALGSLVSTVIGPRTIDELILATGHRLASTPFASMPLAGGEVLVERVSITVLSHVGSGARAAPTRNDAGTLQVAVLADPEFGGPAGSDGYRGWTRELPRLMASRTEALALEKLYGGAPHALYLGRQAAVGNLLGADVRTARILHIATHGYYDPRTPELVGFALTPSDPSDPLSGFVSADVLAPFRFRNELVVLSGCDTGLGRSLPGDGMLSMGRAFLDAGAEAVVTTLWPVADRVAARFMAWFHEGLQREGLAPAPALARAQRLARERWPAERHWAGYRLTVRDLATHRFRVERRLWTGDTAANLR